MFMEIFFVVRLFIRLIWPRAFLLSSFFPLCMYFFIFYIRIYIQIKSLLGTLFSYYFLFWLVVGRQRKSLNVIMGNCVKVNIENLFTNVAENLIKVVLVDCSIKIAILLC